MSLSVLRGLIARRVLLNYRVDPAVVEPLLPGKLRPKLVDGHAIAGICLIRLERLRPQGLPGCFGMASENAAHRIAVTWTEPGSGDQDGVFIFRRETASPLTRLAGGRLFPGAGQSASFQVNQEHGALNIAMRSLDGNADLHVTATRSDHLPQTSIFGDLPAASDFFAAGAKGFSLNPRTGLLEGMTLRVSQWQMTPLTVTRLSSRFYDDTERCPPGSIQFDSALLMEGLEHEWVALPAQECACVG